MPTECGFCGAAASDGTPLHVSVSFDKEAKLRKGALCLGCVRVFILSFAHGDKPAFEALVNEAREWKPGEETTAQRPVEGAKCSFCGKRSAEVERMIAGGDAMICNECVEVAMHVLAQGNRERFERVVEEARQPLDPG
ncbi:MAG TPA: ClpX C4-type zinc finger protein [Rhizomicrobium sp.]|nr:ClpX C4-type zinc finger protein [Rhizomicrobium sp.]